MEFDRIVNEWMNSFVRNNREGLRAVRDFLSSIIEFFYGIFSFHFVVLFILFAAAAYFSSSGKVWRKAVNTGIVVALLGLVYLLGFWDLAISTLTLVIINMIIAVIIGVPIGMLISESKLAAKIIIPILDFMQTIPTFVYLIPAIMLFGLGQVSALLAMLIYSVPFLVRITYLGATSIDSSSIEASLAFGANRLQMFTNVKLPLSIRSIIMGFNQSFLASLSMVVTASMVGAGGLGQEVLAAVNQINLGRGLRSGICIVIIAIIISRITGELFSKFKYDKEVA